MKAYSNTLNIRVVKQYEVETKCFHIECFFIAAGLITPCNVIFMDI